MLRVIGHILQELRRRRVGRVVAAYAVVGWIITEASSVVFPALHLPEWTVTLVVGLLIAGFPIAVVLAWAFDLTPEGVQRTGPESRAHGTPAAVTDEPAVGYGPREEASPNDRSIAVIPFANLTRNPDDDPFVDGLTDELISHLAHVPGIRVSARTSTFALRDKGLVAQEIGKLLDVGRLVEGSVRITGERVRLTAHLSDATRGGTVWSETYEMELDDLFEVQSKIARSIADRVRPQADSEPNPAERRATTDVRAYAEYARGRYQWNRRTPARLKQAIEHFENAIELDPAYAAAYAGLADAHSILADYGIVEPSATLERAVYAAETAVSLAPELGECRTALAVAQQLRWEWKRAERSFRSAQDAAPSYAVAHQRYALHLAWLGREEESVAAIERALELDPLSPAMQASRGWIYYYARRYQEAIDVLRSLLEADPDVSAALSALGLALGAIGEHGQAVEAHEKALRSSLRSTASQSLLAYALGRAGEAKAAEEVSTELERGRSESYVSPYYMALPHLGMGRLDTALDHLEDAVKERSPHLVYANVEPILDPVRPQERFLELLTRVGFPDRATAR